MEIGTDVAVSSASGTKLPFCIPLPSFVGVELDIVRFSCCRSVALTATDVLLVIFLSISRFNWNRLLRQKVVVFNTPSQHYISSVIECKFAAWKSMQECPV